MNNKSDIILSVCIPTYNRAGFLKNSLESLYRQLDGNNQNSVEILVSNNCSTDDTDSLVHSYLDKGMPIAYFKNKENIGPDRNFLQCIYKARGKYVLLLGDDDLLLDGSINTLIQILSKNDYGVVYLSGRPYAERNRKGPAYSDVNLKNETYRDNNSFLRREQVNITFMSGNLFNKTLIPEFDASIYAKSNLIQVPFFLYAACRAEKNLFLEEKFLAVGGNGDNNGGYGLYKVFGVNLFDMLTSFKREGVTDETIRNIANSTLLRFFPYFILVSRKKGNFSSESIRVMEKYHADNWRYKYVDYPLFALPLPVAKAFFFGYRCIRKIFHICGIWKD